MQVLSVLWWLSHASKSYKQPWVTKPLSLAPWPIPSSISDPSSLHVLLLFLFSCQSQNPTSPQHTGMLPRLVHENQSSGTIKKPRENEELSPCRAPSKLWATGPILTPHGKNQSEDESKMGGIEKHDGKCLRLDWLEEESEKGILLQDIY